MNNIIVTGMMVLGMAFGLSGCQGDERITQVSAQERKAQIEVDNKSALEMETDLQIRQRFYQGVAGTFEGMATGESGTNYKIRILLIPSLPPFKPNRIRMREEVASDLSKLFFNAQVILWNPESKIGAVGCLASGISPDLNKGEVIIASPDCPNVYKILIHNQGLINGKVQGTSFENSAAVAQALMDGNENTVQALYGTIHPKTTSETINFGVERTL